MENIKNNIPVVSESEWKVMDLLWKESPMTSFQIIEKLKNEEWAPQTIKTLIHRLEKKGVIAHEKKRREHLYFPLIAKNKYVKKESKSFIDKIFKGATGPMISYFLENGELSEDEIQKIKKLIDSMEGH